MNPVIAEIRKRLKGKTQNALAAEMDISPSYLCDLLKGRREVSQNIADMFGYVMVWRKK